MNPYRNLKDKEPDSRGQREAVRYASGMSKKSKSPWRQLPTCKCVKADLPTVGRVVIRCERHRGKPSGKRLLCYWDDGMVRSETPLKMEPAPKPESKAKPKKQFHPRVLPGQRVYFARLGDLIKIGISTDVETRVERLNADLLGSIVGGRKRENELHDEFAGLRERGEWFRAEPHLLSRIEELCAE